MTTLGNNSRQQSRMLQVSSELDSPNNNNSSQNCHGHQRPKRKPKMVDNSETLSRGQDERLSRAVSSRSSSSSPIEERIIRSNIVSNDSNDDYSRTITTNQRLMATKSSIHGVESSTTNKNHNESRLQLPDNHKFSQQFERHEGQEAKLSKITVSKLSCRELICANRFRPNLELIQSSRDQSSRWLLVSLMAILLATLMISNSPFGGHTLALRTPTGSRLPATGSGSSSSQLLRMADVELIRRLERLERDTSIAPNISPSSASLAITEAPPTGSATCGYPGSPAHASVTFNTSNVVAGTAASYTCDNGYELLGPTRRICQPNGTWSPIGIPFCVLNVGLGKAAMQSSTAGHGSAQKAVDGSTSSYFQASTCTMTDVEHSPWWYINLLEPYLVQIVRIDFGTACCANGQKATIAVRVGNNRPDLGSNPLCNRYTGFIEEGRPLFLPCTRPAAGAFVSIHLESPSGSSLSICETFIYTDHALSIEQCPSFRDQPLGSTATYNGKCYLFHNNQALSFDSARKYCESRGGTLVDETSPALQGFLSWELYRRHRNDQLMGQYWLGAIRDPRDPSSWKWINNKEVQISFWYSPERKLRDQAALAQGSLGNCSRFDGSKGWLWSDTDCQANLNFICQYRPLSCGKPEKPTNSTLITKNIDNGTVIEYQCAPGNLLMGPKSRACLPTGFFSEFAPKCKYLDCHPPAMIQNGDYKLLNGTTSYQSVVTYFCNEGHQLFGRATLQCDVDERWNGPPPRCEPMLCSAPVVPLNGLITLTSNVTIPGTQATYECRAGHELVGDRLLTCLPSGSWDNSFPYCRERRSTPVATPSLSGAPRVPQPAPPGQRLAPSAAPRPAGGVVFPQGHHHAFSSARLPTTSSSTAPPPQTPSTTIAPLQSPSVATSTGSTTNSPVSLNGLASQFMRQSTSTQPSTSGPASATSSSSESGQESAETNGQQQTRKVAAQSSSNVGRFAEPAPAISSNEINLSHQPARFRPTESSIFSLSSQTPGLTGNGAQLSSTSSSRQPIVTAQQSGASNSAGKFTFVGLPPIPSAGGSSSQAASPTPSIDGHGPTGSSLGYDTSPLATSNAVSVHSSGAPSNVASSPSAPSSTTGGSQASTPASSPSSSSVSVSSTTSATTMAIPVVTQQQQQHHHHNAAGSGQNVLASFSPPVRSHNALANAKYSLDGIIAVAIFGGFIFLGAIITIIVIIIRRKSSHSSTIDAQTICTYDSNGEPHNGMYRNYQQAWENLRFASPGSQPKSSGMSGGVGLITAHVSAGPQIGALKNYASPTMGLHPMGVAQHHQHQHAAAQHLHAMMAANGVATSGMGHHNLAMEGSTTSSQTGSSLGDAGNGGLSSGGEGPLLRGGTGNGRHHHHHHHHHHHPHHRNRLSEAEPIDNHNDEEDDIDEEDDDEDIINLPEMGQGPMTGNQRKRLSSSSCEDGGAQFEQRSAHHHHHRHSHEHGHRGEGLREANELTINADQVNAVNGSSTANASSRASRCLYQVGGQQQSRGHHHHHHSHHQGGSSNGSSGHQRLVVSSTPSNSTTSHSSRASPPSDDQSLDRLAYGNNWHEVAVTSGANSTNGVSSAGGQNGRPMGNGASGNARYS